MLANHIENKRILRQMRHHLKTTGMGLGLLRLELNAGRIKEARATLALLQNDFQHLLGDVQEEAENSATEPDAGSTEERWSPKLYDACDTEPMPGHPSATGRFENRCSR